ncbi:MAG: hypothetical protein IPL67_10580 [Ignavibacteria bacterium]|nr:hypothetical protein [Ignavibacteria bacterium]
MTKTDKKLIKLYPYERFFFGGENTFGENNTNYMVRSEFFPQQTSLLGLLRYQILLKAGDDIFKDNRIIDKDGAAKLIGEKSFDPTSTNDFKKIKCISPVFVSIRRLFLVPCKPGVYARKRFVQVSQFRQRRFRSGKSPIQRNIKTDFVPDMKDFQAKKGLDNLLINRELVMRKYLYESGSAH